MVICYLKDRQELVREQVFSNSLPGTTIAITLYASLSYHLRRLNTQAKALII